MLTSPDLGTAIQRIHRRIDSIRDRLNEADARLGDGDTGMTVATLVEAVHAASAALPEDVGAALAVWGRECRQASGSSLAAVVAIGLSRAARTLAGRVAVDRTGIAGALERAAEAITERSGATAGDKTILDSLLRIGTALGTGDGSAPALTVALAAAGSALDDLRPGQSKAGRARIYGARSMGADDPGMLAVCLLLQAAIEADPQHLPGADI